MPRRNRKGRTPNQHPKRRHKQGALDRQTPAESPDGEPKPEPDQRSATGISPQSPAAG